MHSFLRRFLAAIKGASKTIVRAHDRIVRRFGSLKVYMAETVVLGLIVAPESTVKVLAMAFMLWLAAKLIRRWK